jgi:hypothetical protein
MAGVPGHPAEKWREGGGLSRLRIFIHQSMQASRDGGNYFASASVWAMIDGPVIFTPQGGNSFTVKKLSGRSVQ